MSFLNSNNKSRMSLYFLERWQYQPMWVIIRLPPNSISLEYSLTKISCYSVEFHTCRRWKKIYKTRRIIKTTDSIGTIINRYCENRTLPFCYFLEVAKTETTFQVRPDFPTVISYFRIQTLSIVFMIHKLTFSRTINITYKNYIFYPRNKSFLTCVFTST